MRSPFDWLETLPGHRLMAETSAMRSLACDGSGWIHPQPAGRYEVAHD